MGHCLNSELCIVPVLIMMLRSTWISGWKSRKQQNNWLLLMFSNLVVGEH